ncbi:hypothetical protein CB1_000309003 [Camelus ferus]|nr:hypothetical protein CB1_000309003 [Camelus ferus]
MGFRLCAFPKPRASSQLCAELTALIAGSQGPGVGQLPELERAQVRPAPAPHREAPALFCAKALSPSSFLVNENWYKQGNKRQAGRGLPGARVCRAGAADLSADTALPGSPALLLPLRLVPVEGPPAELPGLLKPGQRMFVLLTVVVLIQCQFSSGYFFLRLNECLALEAGESSWLGAEDTRNMDKIPQARECVGNIGMGGGKVQYFRTALVLRKFPPSDALDVLGNGFAFNGPPGLGSGGFVCHHCLCLTKILSSGSSFEGRTCTDPPGFSRIFKSIICLPEEQTNSQKIDRLDGAHAPELTKKVQRHASSGSFPPSGNEHPKEDLSLRLKKLIHAAPCMLFMKGTPQEPRCGFSKQMVEILNKHNIQFSSFDIFSDEEVRQGLKTYSSWPTYPQLYVSGELIGGLDIVKELEASEELDTICPKAPKLEESVDYETFDILEDEEVRQGLKTYSNWPTYPQLYVKGELVGGLDIVKTSITISMTTTSRYSHCRCRDGLFLPLT